LRVNRETRAGRNPRSPGAARRGTACARSGVTHSATRRRSGAGGPRRRSSPQIAVTAASRPPVVAGLRDASRASSSAEPTVTRNSTHWAIPWPAPVGTVGAAEPTTTDEVFKAEPLSNAVGRSRGMPVMTSLLDEDCAAAPTGARSPWPPASSPSVRTCMPNRPASTAGRSVQRTAVHAGDPRCRPGRRSTSPMWSVSTIDNPGCTGPGACRSVSSVQPARARVKRTGSAPDVHCHAGCGVHHLLLGASLCRVNTRQGISRRSCWRCRQTNGASIEWSSQVVQGGRDLAGVTFDSAAYPPHARIV